MSKPTVSLPQPAEAKSEVRIPMPSDPDSCEFCGTARTSGAAFCPQCGLALKAPTEPAGRSTQVAGARSDSLPPADAGLGANGRQRSDQPLLPLIGPNAPRDCQSAATKCVCGAVLPQGAGFCHLCGLRVGQNRPRVRLIQRSSHGTPAEAELLGDELTIGKEPECDLVIPDDEYMSRRHARLFQADGMLFVEDLGSSNGTFLRVRRPIVLEHGDELVVGTHVVRVGHADGRGNLS